MAQALRHQSQTDQVRTKPPFVVDANPHVSTTSVELPQLFKRLARLRRRFRARYAREHGEILPASQSIVPVSPQRLVPITELYGVRVTNQGLLFVQPDDGFKHIAVAGEFNDWKADRHPFKKNDKLNVWYLLVAVPPGRYAYRLIVDGRWHKDVYNKYIEANPYGGLNNVIEVIAVS